MGTAMKSRRFELGSVVKMHREHRKLSQDEVARNCGVETNRTAIAHLEQGLRLPKPEVIGSICRYLDIPSPQWEPFTNKDSLLRFEFEEWLSEFVGQPLSLDVHHSAAQKTAEDLIATLFSSNPSADQLLDKFNSILVYYGTGPIRKDFFHDTLRRLRFAQLRGSQSQLSIIKWMRFVFLQHLPRPSRNSTTPLTLQAY